MNLEQIINDALKEAMKSGNKVRTVTLRSIRASIIEFSKSGAGREMSPEDELKILTSAAKKRKDAIEMYKSAGRTDLSDNEELELAVIQEFLPKQLDESEVKDAIKSIIDSMGATSAKDAGRVIGAAMKELKGKADGSLIQQLVKNILS